MIDYSFNIYRGPCVFTRTVLYAGQVGTERCDLWSIRGRHAFTRAFRGSQVRPAMHVSFVFLFPAVSSAANFSLFEFGLTFSLNYENVSKYTFNIVSIFVASD